MNDEIKINKTNKSITFINNGIAFSQFGITDEILDLITNLQEQLEIKNEGFKSTVEELCETSEKLESLQEENERLKEENKRIFSKVNDDELLISNAMNYAEAQKYKSRCEKAIEYIKNNKYKKMSGYGDNEDEDIEICLFEDDINNLLNILTGGDE